MVAAVDRSNDAGALLLLLLDGRAPAGAHHHSSGMEPAVTAGWISDADDVTEFCRRRLATSGSLAAAFAACAHRFWTSGPSGGVSAQSWVALDAEFDARTPAEAARAASRQLGSGLRRLIRALGLISDAEFAEAFLLCPRPSAHHPLLLGAAVALADGSAELAARAAALYCCTGPASAAVRLLGLDPFTVQGILARLAPEIDQVATEAAAALPPSGLPDLTALPAAGAPAMELLADIHHTAEVRLFAS